MPRSKTTGRESTHASTVRGGAKPSPASDPESVQRFAETLRLRSLAVATQAEYLRFVRKLVTRHGGDPAALDEAQVRAHLLHLKDAHHYSPSSMRTAVAAMRAYYGLHLGRPWKLFDLVRSPSAQKLPTVLTRTEVLRLFAVVRVARMGRRHLVGEQPGPPFAQVAAARRPLSEGRDGTPAPRRSRGSSPRGKQPMTRSSGACRCSTRSTAGPRRRSRSSAVRRR